jgi:hypothetical protein
VLIAHLPSLVNLRKDLNKVDFLNRFGLVFNLFYSVPHKTQNQMKRILPTFFLNFTIISLIVLVQVNTLKGQCACTNCPLNIAPFGITETTINVSGATSNVLNTSQFVKALKIHLVHDAFRECLVTLIAPNGSSVVLSINLSLSFDENITYDICFLDCTETAVPDPGFPANFISNAGYQDNQTYTGSYYPYDFECLSTLTGPVNGIWTLRFQDFVPVEGGDIVELGFGICQ